MRFKVDENLPADLVEDLRLAGHDAKTVFEEALSGAADAELMETARAEAIILLTLDKGIANMLSYPPGTHAGVVLFRPGSAGRAAVLEFVRSRLHELLRADIHNRITVVSDTRIRIR